MRIGSRSTNGVYITISDRKKRSRSKTITVYDVTVADMAKLIRKTIEAQARNFPAKEQSAA